MTKLTLTELAAESVELLPSRDTLFFNVNLAQVVASNSSLALNAVTWGSLANSAAGQWISVSQY